MAKAVWIVLTARRLCLVQGMTSPQARITMDNARSSRRQPPRAAVVRPNKQVLREPIPATYLALIRERKLKIPASESEFRDGVVFAARLVRSRDDGERDYLGALLIVLAEYAQGPIGSVRHLKTLKDEAARQRGHAMTPSAPVPGAKVTTILRKTPRPQRKRS